MTIFLAAALVCVVLLLSLVIWSIRLHRDPKLRIESSSPIDELMPTLAGLTLGTAVPGNSVEVLENGAFFDVLLDRIRSAQKSVHFETFLWKEGALGERVANALSERGAFWEDRYHVTAIEADEHLHRCLVYIDLNMVRAGVVTHPSEWPHSGYREIQDPPKRYGIIDLRQLSALCGFSEVADFQRAHRDWVDEALKGEMVGRESRWSEAVAVGSLNFVNTVKSELGFKAAHREVTEQSETYVLREESEAYRSNFAGENAVLSSENARFWNENLEATET